MENVRVKLHAIPKGLQKIWPQNKIVYTIECYTSGRTWSDNTISLAIQGMGYKDFLKAMDGKFNCILHDFRFFYPTKKDCEDAIEFLESLMILNELS